MRWTPILVLFGLSLLAPPALAQVGSAVPEEPRSPAEIRADMLDRLFASLHGGKDEAAAKSVEAKIWDIWMTSDSPSAEVLLRQATKATDEGAPEEALKILDGLVARFPDFAEAWNRRATLYFLMRRYDAALKDIERVLAIEPRHFGALAGRGMIYQKLKDYGAAIAAYREAIAINPAMQGPKDALEELQKLEQDI